MTFAVVVPVTASPLWDGHLYAYVGDKLCRAMNSSYAQAMTCGADLRDKAESEAAKLGGFVVAVESKYWPGDRDILAAVVAARGAA